MGLSFPFPLRYLMASNPKVLSVVLAITLRAITGWLRKKAKSLGEQGAFHAGAVTLVQRFGGSLNLNLHFHMLILDEVYVGREEPFFIQIPPPTAEEVSKLIKTLSTRILRCLTRRGYFEAHPESGGMKSDSIAEAEPLLASCMAFMGMGGAHSFYQIEVGWKKVGL